MHKIDKCTNIDLIIQLDHDVSLLLDKLQQQKAKIDIKIQEKMYKLTKLIRRKAGIDPVYFINNVVHRIEFKFRDSIYCKIQDFVKEKSDEIQKHEIFHAQFTFYPGYDEHDQYYSIFVKLDIKNQNVPQIYQGRELYCEKKIHFSISGDIMTYFFKVFTHPKRKPIPIQNFVNINMINHPIRFFMGFLGELDYIYREYENDYTHLLYKMFTETNFQYLINHHNFYETNLFYFQNFYSHFQKLKEYNYDDRVLKESISTLNEEFIDNNGLYNFNTVFYQDSRKEVLSCLRYQLEMLIKDISYQYRFKNNPIEYTLTLQKTYNKNDIRLLEKTILEQMKSKIDPLIQSVKNNSKSFNKIVFALRNQFVNDIVDQVINHIFEEYKVFNLFNTISINYTFKQEDISLTDVDPNLFEVNFNVKIINQFTKNKREQAYTEKKFLKFSLAGVVLKYLSWFPEHCLDQFLDQNDFKNNPKSFLIDGLSELDKEFTVYEDLYKLILVRYNIEFPERNLEFREKLWRKIKPINVDLYIEFYKMEKIYSTIISDIFYRDLKIKSDFDLNKEILDDCIDDFRKNLIYVMKESPKVTIDNLTISDKYLYMIHLYTIFQYIPDYKVEEIMDVSDPNVRLAGVVRDSFTNVPIDNFDLENLLGNSDCNSLYSVAEYIGDNVKTYILDDNN